MNLMTQIAARFAKHVFYTSPYACMRIFKHAVQMPVGIDTNIFKPQTGIIRKDRSVLFLGRLSPVKRPELFIDACVEKDLGMVDIYGNDPKGTCTEYEEGLKKRSQGRIQFHDAVPNYETPAIYSACEVYVNLTPEGSMDKTVLEAAACGALILVSNRSFEGLVPDDCILRSDDPGTIGERVQYLYNLSDEQKRTYREALQNMVREKHSLTALITKLVTYIGV